METDKKKKKSSACVSLTVFCFSFNKQANYRDMGVDQHLFFKWWNLVSFYHEIVLLENIDPDEREDGAKAVILYNGLKFSTSSGLTLLTELLPIVSLENYLNGDFLLLFVITFCYIYSSCAAKLITGFGERQIRQFGTRILMISHLDFFLILTLSEFDWKGK